MKNKTYEKTVFERLAAIFRLLILLGVVPMGLAGADENLPKELAGTNSSSNAALSKNIASEWDIAAWDDGGSRNVGDYKGKVVFIDFWGVWCGPCLRMIPALKAVKEKYEPKGVVFLSIHTPGTSMEGVLAVMKKESWSSTVGLDKGTEVSEGLTAMSYGVKGYPTIVIINAEGVIAYDSNSERSRRTEDELAALAKEVGLPWPLNMETKDIEAITKRMNKLTVHMLSIEIAQLLPLEQGLDGAKRPEDADGRSAVAVDSKDE